MTLRTPNPSSNATLTLSLRRIKESRAILQEQLTTGNRIVRLGQDPTGAALIVDFQTSIGRNKQFVKQIDSAASYLTETETALDSVNTSLTRLLELAPTAESTSATAGDRLQMVPEINGILTSLLSVANTQQQGKYLFGGSNTTTAPFTQTATGANYNGNSATISLDVSVSASVGTNLPGNTVFYGSGGQGSATDVFKQVTDLSAALTANNSAGIQTAMDNLKMAFSGLQTNLAEIGGRQSTLDQMKTTLGDFTTSLQSIQNTYASVDYAQAASDYESQGIAQQATLAMIGKSNAQNLFDYLT